MTVFMYILYDLSIFLSSECVIEIYFIVPDRASWKNSLVLNGCFTLYKYIWNKKNMLFKLVMQNDTKGLRCEVFSQVIAIEPFSC